MLQTLAALADTNSQIYLLVKWFDPAIYLPNDAVVYLVFCIIVVFAVALIGMLATCDSDCLLKTPSTAKLYFSYALCYLLLLTETFLMAPLLRSSVQCFKDKILLGLGMVNLSIYLFVMLPLALFCSNNDFSLSSSLHNRVYRLNMYFLFTVVRSKMILFSALKPSLSPIFIVIFFILYVVVSLKRPFVSYRYDWALRGILAIIGFMCLSRIYELLVGLQSALLYITGMILFVVFADTLSKMRVKHILNNPNMTTLKIKTLLYLIYDL